MCVCAGHAMIRGGISLLVNSGVSIYLFSLYLNLEDTYPSISSLYWPPFFLPQQTANGELKVLSNIFLHSWLGQLSEYNMESKYQYNMESKYLLENQCANFPKQTYWILCMFWKSIFFWSSRKKWRKIISKRDQIKVITKYVYTRNLLSFW